MSLTQHSAPSTSPRTLHPEPPALLGVAGILSLIEPKRPWLWALGVGVWIPLHGIINTGNWTILVALLFPFVGAYGGMGIRKLAALSNRQ